MSTLYTFFSRRLFWLALMAIFIMTASQLFGRMLWQLELVSHYVPHTAVLLLLATIFYPKPTFRKGSKNLPYRVIRIVFLLLGLGFTIWSLQPLSLIPAKISDKKGNLTNTHPKSITPPLTIYYQNVNIGNEQSLSLVERLIPNSKKKITNVEINADIITLVEAGGTQWGESLSGLNRHYPMHCGVNESSPFAMQIYAKDAKTRRDIVKREGVVLAKLTLADNRILYFAHPPPPISQTMAQARNKYLQALAILIKEDTTHHVMVVGDFNLSAFSPVYRDFIAESSTTNGDVKRTTLTGLPTWLPFAIGIDHVLTTDKTSDVQTHPLGWHGSDHRGFLIKW